MESKYLIVQSDTEENAKLRLRQLVLDLGYTEYNYLYLIGSKNIGMANNVVIKNNFILSDWGNGNYCFEIDSNIITEHGTAIQEAATANEGIYLCTEKELEQYFPPDTEGEF